MSYLNPTSDLVFKKLFGTEVNKDLLISFLNGILELEGDRLIVTVDFTNPYNHHPLEDTKLSIVDVKCKDQAGNIYIVEMQVNSQTGFLARCQYYASCGLSMQLAALADYKTLLPVIFIGVADFKIFSDHDRYISHYRLTDSVDNVCRLHHTEYHFIELEKFTKTIDQLEDIADKWIYFLKNAERCESTPQELKKTQPLVKAFDVLERGRWTRQELENYEKSLDARRVEKGTLEAAEIRGEVKRSIKIAKDMLLEDVKIDFICRMTGLSEQEVEELKAGLKK